MATAMITTTEAKALPLRRKAVVIATIAMIGSMD
jgi:hypothetical protein